jgi:uncharacterized membrane-anchored protein
MKRWMMALALAAASAMVSAQDKGASKDDPGAAFRNLPWVTGPEQGKIAEQATVKLGQDFGFLGEQGTSRFLELNGNPPRPGHYTLVPKEGSWFAVFHFNPDGYVRDNEKIDADALLKSMKEGDESGNEERKRHGMQPIYTDGWSVPPHYDQATRRLEWGVRLKDHDGRFIVNYTSRLLGREGVMTAVLVSNTETLDRDRAAFAKALDGFTYNSGKSYAEFKEGDKVAAYGLGALVLGGAAAAAAKTGAGKALFKGLWIALAAGAAGVWAFAKRMMGKKA